MSPLGSLLTPRSAGEALPNDRACSMREGGREGGGKGEGERKARPSEILYVLEFARWHHNISGHPSLPPTRSPPHTQTHTHMPIHQRLETGPQQWGECSRHKNKHAKNKLISWICPVTVTPLSPQRNPLHTHTQTHANTCKQPHTTHSRHTTQ